MVGFFDDPTADSALPSQGSSPNVLSSNTTLSTAIQRRLIEFISRKIDQYTPGLVATTTIVQGLINPSQDSLLISIKPSPILLDLVRSLKENLPELGLRLKGINHISLCYWDQPANEQKAMEQRTQWIDEATVLAQQHFTSLHGKVNSNTISGNAEEEIHFLNDSWDIVLYSIRNRDKNNSIPYSLVELKRWVLP
ncbi:hypothetical protein BGZ46_006643 [Entomortierella lignicola]|nr:hypothetical protein BGZ46_006643 [Entomortierella lignicola]